MVNMRQALGVDDFNQMSNYTGQLQNKRRSVGQKDYGLGGKALDMAAALGDAYNQYQPPETALGMMALPAKAVYGLGNMIVQDVGDKTKSIMGTDINNPAAMNQAATDAFGLAADTMAGGGVVSRMTDMPTGAVLGANVFQGGPHKYGPEGAAESLKHMSKGEGAQAYGWGRYDAENIDVAEQYKRDLSGFDELTLHTKSGLKRGEALDDIDLDLAKYLEGGAKDAGQFPHNTVYYAKKRAEAAGKDGVVKRLNEYGPDARFSYEKNMGNLYKHDLPDEDIARYLDWDAPLSEQPHLAPFANEMKDRERQNILKRASIADKEAAGARSSVSDAELDEIYKELGDFKVAPEVQARNLEIAQKAQAERTEALLELQFGPDKKGQGFYKELEAVYGSDKAASEALAKAGIPGLKYYDGMSRGINRTGSVEKVGDKWTATIQGPHSSTNKNFSTKPEADKWVKSKVDGTRNFVTWDQDVLNRMKLLERNNEDMTKALMPK